MDSFGPDQEPPRFTDTIVEYAQRLERELKDRKVGDYVPALVMVSTTGNEAADSQRQEIERAVKSLITRRARLVVAVMNTKAGDATAAAEVTTVRQALIAIPAVKATNGRFEALPVASRLATLLPEIGQQLAVAHTRQSKQFRVTVERPAGVTGPLQNPQIALTRTGLSGAVTLDGRLP
jgi:GTPase